MDLVLVQWEFVRNVNKLLTFIDDSNFMVTFGEAFRPYDLQLLYVHGKGIEEYDGQLVFKEAKKREFTKTSKHLKRLAIDLNFFITNDNNEYDLTYNVDLIQCIGEYWESLNENNVWGGFWKNPDPNHFQMAY